MYELVYDSGTHAVLYVCIDSEISFLWTPFFQDSLMNESTKLHLFEIEIFDNNVKVFASFLTNLLHPLQR